MSTVGTARDACVGAGAFRHQRHRPEKTLIYQLVCMRDGRLVGQISRHDIMRALDEIYLRK